MGVFVLVFRTVASRTRPARNRRLAIIIPCLIYPPHHCSIPLVTLKNQVRAESSEGDPHPLSIWVLRPCTEMFSRTCIYNCSCPEHADWDHFSTDKARR